jgi:hypothetical protein
MSNKLPKTVFNKVLKEMGFRYRSSSHNFMKSNGAEVDGAEGIATKIEAC